MNRRFFALGAFCLAWVGCGFAAQNQGEDLLLSDGFEAAPTPLSRADAARFLTQATFGPTTAAISELQALGYQAWLEHQFRLIGTPHRDYYSDVEHGYSGSNDLGRHEKWWQDVAEGEDQLRQRVAFALSQILVISDVGRPLNISQLGVSHYYDILRAGAFGNYRDLLATVTLNPVMGTFLSMAGNERADLANNVRPDENYAREVLQLFTIGVSMLNQNGQTQRDSAGHEIATYSEATVKEFARVFTGWELPGLRAWRQTTEDINSIQPMQVWAEYHDTDAKELLNGERLAAGQSAEQDLRQALDNIFNHSNVAPFISKQLIQRLVTSNPTPDYVARVAAAFNDNGSGRRGDLRAVVQAILLDREARHGHIEVSDFGKPREPLLRLTHVWRAFSIRRGNNNRHGEFTTASPQLDSISRETGQQVLSAPSVFNFYHPNYSPPGPVRDAGLVAPEFEIATDNNILATANRISQQIQYYYLGNIANATNQSHLDLSREIDLAANPDALLDHLDILLLSGSMSEAMRGLLRSHLAAIPSNQQGLSQRARDAITLIVASPDYLIQM